MVGALDPALFYVDRDVARDALRRRSMFNVIEITTGWKLDLVIRKARPFSVEEMRRRTPTRILGIEVPIATAEDTIIAKLEWAKLGASDRQLEDVAGFCEFVDQVSISSTSSIGSASCILVSTGNGRAPLSPRHDSLLASDEYQERP